MTIRIRRSEDRGSADHGWLDTRHTFSFAGYHDPQHMGFRSLRVINDDRVVGGAGFGTHPHRDMEIISYVVEGALSHEDSMGHGSVIRPGEVQRMSAGTGVTHSEFNHAADAPLRFLQIWIQPESPGGPPGYEQKRFGDERSDRLRLVASRDGREGSLTVRQDVSLYAAVLEPGASVSHEVEGDRAAWVQIVRGQVRLGEHVLREGDGAAVESAGAITLEAVEPAEILLFDLA